MESRPLRPGHRRLHDLAPGQTRPRLDHCLTRIGAGIVLADVSDNDILALLDAGLQRIEIAKHFGVEDHIIRYRIRVMRDLNMLPETDLPYGRFFIDDLVTACGDAFFFMIPAHRRGAWEAFKAIPVGDRPAEPAWAVDLADFSRLEFSAPKSFGAYANGGHV